MSKEKVRITEDGQVLNVHTEDGQEIPDSVPMAPPIGFKRREPLHERIRAMVQNEFNRVRAQSEVESPEEADDFRIPGEDDDDPRESRFALMPGYEWEDNYEPPDTFAEMKARLVEAGWTPPPAKPGQEVSAEKPGSSEVAAKPLDAAPPADNRAEPPRGSGSKP